jgi:hypothetical protein
LAGRHQHLHQALVPAMPLLLLLLLKDTWRLCYLLLLLRWRL